VANDTVTLALHGDVSLEQFADAIRRFDSLIQALAQETGAAGVRWMVADLEVSSTLATARGTAPDGTVEPEEVEQVVRGFLLVGQSLERARPIPFSPRVRREAKALTKVLNGGVRAIRFETAEADASVRVPTAPPEAVLVEPPAWGAVEGRVQTLTSRGGLRFTLYDTIHDRAVSCYLAEGAQDVMRDVWGRLAVVEGQVTRDVESGRPLSVRQVRSVSALPEQSAQTYRGLRGLSPSELPAEEAIRRLRDAG
jgi:hypothetical protein